MDKSLFVWGANHHSAPLAVRERLVLTPEQITTVIHSLQAAWPPSAQLEALVLSTCNRMELYIARFGSSAWEPAEEQRLLQIFDAVLPAGWSQSFASFRFWREQIAVVRHLFTVSAGLDSVVLGETQITGQVKKSLALARQIKGVGTALNRLFESALANAKQIRSATAISQKVVSYAAVAVRLSQQIFGELNQSRVLFIGAGEMIGLTLAHFAAQQPLQMALTNRSSARAQQWQGRYALDIFDFSQLAERLAQFDIIVTCTAAPLPIIDTAMVKRALKERRHRPMVLVDLAVPRDVTVLGVSDVYVYTIDDLGALAQQGRDARQGEMTRALAIVEQQTDKWWQRYAQQKFTPELKRLQLRAQQIQATELAHARSLLKQGKPADVVLSKLSDRLSARFLDSLWQLPQADWTQPETAMAQLLQTRRGRKTKS